jgi:hypothetical protein
MAEDYRRPDLSAQTSAAVANNLIHAVSRTAVAVAVVAVVTEEDVAGLAASGP